MTPGNFLDRKGFCILPFVHSCIFQNGNAQPCCMNYLPLGNTKEQSIEEIYSGKNKKLTDFRKEFLSDSLPVSCFKCIDIEKNQGHSYRNFSNQSYGYLLDQLDINNEEDLINNEKIFLWDVRFSNLCNLKCLVCRPEDSSRIAEEEEEGKLVTAFDDIDQFIVAFEKQIDNIIEINFAGGEPLLIKDHYKILELLIKYEKFNVNLRYNTNGTTITLGDKNIIEYWKYFKEVKVNFSIDAGWEQFEYLRYGANWEIVLQNLRRVAHFTPDCRISLNIVITAMNVLYIRELYEFLLTEVSIINLNVVPVYGKPYYSISILPNSLKEQAIQYYQEWEDNFYNSYSPHKNHASISITSVIRSINMIKNMIITEKDTSSDLHILKKHILIKDKIRGTDFYATFPKLKDIFNNV